MLEWFDSTATLFVRFYSFRERDGMVDMSGLDSGDSCRVGSSPAARRFIMHFWSLKWLSFFIFDLVTYK